MCRCLWGVSYLGQREVMFEDEKLNNVVENKRARRFDNTVRLCSAVERFVDEHVSPRQAKYCAVSEVWGQLLPLELREHCEIADISGGQLKVRVDSPAYKYELQLCGSELLEELRRQCPKVRLTRITFVIG